MAEAAGFLPEVSGCSSPATTVNSLWQAMRPAGEGEFGGERQFRLLGSRLFFRLLFASVRLTTGSGKRGRCDNSPLSPKSPH
jgi:hypothetical protein